MKFVIAIVVVALVCGGLIYLKTRKTPIPLRPAANDVPVDEALPLPIFAEEMLQLLSKLHPESDYSYDADTNMISELGEGSAQFSFFLGNIYNRAKHLSAAERATFLNDFIRESQSDLDISLEDFVRNIRLRVRSKGELDSRQFAFSDPDNADLKLVTAQSGELFLELIEDRENSIRIVNSDDLEKLSINENDAIENAISNIKEITSGNIWRQDAPHIWSSSPSDDYDVARLVALYPNISLPFTEDLIAYFPSHSVCVITDKSDPETLRNLVSLGDQMATDQRPLSMALWHVKKAQWHKWIPDKLHLSYDVAKLQMIKNQLLDHDNQKALMEIAFNNENEDIFVAKLSAYSNEDTGFFTLAVYTIDVDTLLPKAEQIAVFDLEAGPEGAMLGQMPWSDFVNLIGVDKLKEYKSLTPPRYDLVKKLDEADYKRIRAHFE